MEVVKEIEFQLISDLKRIGDLNKKNSIFFEKIRMLNYKFNGNIFKLESLKSNDLFLRLALAVKNNNLKLKLKENKNKDIDVFSLTSFFKILSKNEVVNLDFFLDENYNLLKNEIKDLEGIGRINYKLLKIELKDLVEIKKIKDKLKFYKNVEIDNYLKQKDEELKNLDIEFEDKLFIFSDGSKKDSRAGYCVIVLNDIKEILYKEKNRIPHNQTSVRAEIVGGIRSLEIGLLLKLRFFWLCDLKWLIERALKILDGIYVKEVKKNVFLMNYLDNLIRNNREILIERRCKFKWVEAHKVDNLGLEEINSIENFGNRLVDGGAKESLVLSNFRFDRKFKRNKGFENMLLYFINDGNKTKDLVNGKINKVLRKCRREKIELELEESSNHWLILKNFVGSLNNKFRIRLNLQVDRFLNKLRLEELMTREKKSLFLEISEKCILCNNGDVDNFDHRLNCIELFEIKERLIEEILEEIKFELNNDVLIEFKDSLKYILENNNVIWRGILVKDLKILINRLEIKKVDIQKLLLIITKGAYNLWRESNDIICGLEELEEELKEEELSEESSEEEESSSESSDSEDLEEWEENILDKEEIKENDLEKERIKRRKRKTKRELEDKRLEEVSIFDKNEGTLIREGKEKKKRDRKKKRILLLEKLEEEIKSFEM